MSSQKHNCPECGLLVMVLRGRLVTHYFRKRTVACEGSWQTVEAEVAPKAPVPVKEKPQALPNVAAIKEQPSDILPVVAAQPPREVPKDRSAALTATDAAGMVDKCLLAMQGHQRVNCLRQDLIQMVLAVDMRSRRVARRVPETKRQSEILQYHREFKERHGYVPSYNQMARHFGVTSKATIAKHVTALRRQGFEVEARS